MLNKQNNKSRYEVAVSDKLFFSFGKLNFLKLFFVIKRRLFKIIKRYFFYSYFKLLRSADKFRFNGQDFFYFFHLYNNTFLNERAVEIPIVKSEIDRVISGSGEILEVGNVMSYYFDFKYDIVDKFDRSPQVIKEDIVNFRPLKLYDLIISVSTLEHVGFDEEIVDETKPARAINVMKDLLKQGGKILFTVPLGYNESLDKLIANNSINFDQGYFLKRVSGVNQWTQSDRSVLSNTKYNYPYPSANTLFIGIINK